MRREDLFKKNHILGIEFDRYVLENPEFLEKIPDGAEIVFLPEDDPELCEENIRLARTHREEGRSIVIIKIERLEPPRSRLVNVRIESGVA